LSGASAFARSSGMANQRSCRCLGRVTLQVSSTLRDCDSMKKWARHSDHGECLAHENGWDVLLFLDQEEANAMPISASIPDELPQPNTHSTHSLIDADPVATPSATFNRRSSASPAAAHSMRLALMIVVL